MRALALVLPSLLVVGQAVVGPAVAGPSTAYEATPELLDAFGVLNRMPESLRGEMSQGKPTCVDEIRQKTEVACTAAIVLSDTSMPHYCRAVVIANLLDYRRNALRVGDDVGLTFKYTCGDYEFTGWITPPVADRWVASNAEFALRQVERSTGRNVFDQMVPLPWPPAAPDPSRPAQWLVATSNSLGRFQRRLAAFVEGVQSEVYVNLEGERRELFAQAKSLVVRLNGFPAYAGDHGLQAATIALIDQLSTDLADGGDLHLLVQRARETNGDRKKRKRGKLKGAAAVPAAVIYERWDTRIKPLRSAVKMATAELVDAVSRTLP
jgi:hypothetical protein